MTQAPTEDYIPPDSSLPCTLSPSIPPIFNRSVAHRGDVVCCFMKLNTPSGVPRLQLTMKTQIGIHPGITEQTTVLMECLPACFFFFFFNGLTCGSAEVFSYLGYRSVKWQWLQMRGGDDAWMHRQTVDGFLCCVSECLLSSFIPHWASLFGCL